MDKVLHIEGVDFHYTVAGEGYPIVLMHGWGCSHTTLASVEAALLPGMKVYNVDFPGFGSSSEPEGVWGVEEYTRLIEEMVKTEGLESPVLLGHSFGGRVGILYSSRNKVKKLILVDAAGVKPTRTLKYYAKVYSYKAMKSVLPVLFGKKKGQELIEKYRGKSGSSDYNNSTPKMRAILSKVVNEDLKHVMPQISCPTLLVWGKNDTATPLKDAQIMEKLIPDAGLVAFDGMGHYSFLENPYQFAAVLKSFLKEEMNG